MLISRTDLDPRKKNRFAWWRMLVWVLLLLAGAGGVEYVHHAQQVWGALQQLPAGDTQGAGALRILLGWDLGYLAAAFVVIVACAGCILRQAWARPVLRAVALVLCVWSAYRGILLWHQWTALNQMMGVLAPGQTMPMDLRRILLIGLILRALAVPALLWLAWQLGQPDVRLQFRARRGRFGGIAG